MGESVERLVEKLYLAYYGRPADAEGFKYWTEKLEKGENFKKVVEAFMNSREAEELYRDKILEEKIKTIYQTLFNREPEKEGLEFYLNKVESGEYSEADVLLRIVEGARGEDEKVLEKKLEYTEWFTDVLGDRIEEKNVSGIREWIKGLGEGEELGELPSLSSSKVKSLFSGEAWKEDTITYSFNKEMPEEYYEAGDSRFYEDWEPFSEKEKEVVREIFKEVEEFTQLKFEEVEEGGEIRFNKTQFNGDEKGYAFYPSEEDPLGGDVWISKEFGEEDFEEGGLGRFVLLHEIGHALGLKHPFEEFTALDEEEQTTNYTVMAYQPQREALVKFSVNGSEVQASAEANAWPSQFGLYDVACLQALYGANTEYNTGDNIYEVSQLYQEKRHLTLWDAGGIDTLDAGSVERKCEVDLEPGSLSSIDIHTAEDQVEEAIEAGELPERAKDWALSFFEELEKQYLGELYTGEDNLAIAEGTLIERVITGEGDDTVKDNQEDNWISTGGGNDIIVLCGEGCDLVDGGKGWDKVVVELPRGEVESEEIGDGVWLIEKIGGAFIGLLWNVEEVGYGV